MAGAVDVEVVDALDGGRIVASALLGDPAPADGVAAPEIVERLEDERRLRAGAGDEILLVGESDRALLYGELTSANFNRKVKCRKPSKYLQEVQQAG